MSQDGTYFRSGYRRPSPGARIGKVTWKSRLVQTHGNRWEWIPAREAQRRWCMARRRKRIIRAPAYTRDVFGIWGIQ